MRPHQPLQTGKAKHLILWGVGLHQPITIEEHALSLLNHYLLLLVAHPRHKPQRHPRGPQLLGHNHLYCSPLLTTTTGDTTTTSGSGSSSVGEVVASVCIHKTPTLWLEDGIEAGDEHVGRNI